MNASDYLLGMGLIALAAAIGYATAGLFPNRKWIGFLVGVICWGALQTLAT